jgi:hypothetical protein
MPNVIPVYYPWRPPCLRHQRTTVMDCYYASCFPSVLARMRSDLELVFDDHEVVMQAQTNRQRSLVSLQPQERTLVDCYNDSFVFSLISRIQSELFILRDNLIRDNLMIVMQAQAYALNPPIVFEIVNFSPFQAMLFEHAVCIQATPMPDEDCCQPWSPLPNDLSQEFTAPDYHSADRVSLASRLMIDRCENMIRPCLPFTSSRTHQLWLFARRNLRSRQLLHFAKTFSRRARTRKHHSRRHNLLPPKSKREPPIRSSFKPSSFNSTLGFPGKTNTKIAIGTHFNFFPICLKFV